MKKEMKRMKKNVGAAAVQSKFVFLFTGAVMMMAKYLMIRLCGSSTDYHHHHTKEYLGIFFLRSY